MAKHLDDEAHLFLHKHVSYEMSFSSELFVAQSLARSEVLVSVFLRIQV